MFLKGSVGNRKFAIKMIQGGQPVFVRSKECSLAAILPRISADFFFADCTLFSFRPFNDDRHFVSPYFSCPQKERVKNFTPFGRSFRAISDVFIHIFFGDSPKMYFLSLSNFVIKFKLSISGEWLMDIQIGYRYGHTVSMAISWVPARHCLVHQSLLLFKLTGPNDLN